MDIQYHLDKAFFTDPLPFRNIDLIQIGRLHCGPHTQVETHVHRSWYELTVVTDGEGEVFTNGEGTRVRRGDIYLSYPGDAHGLSSDPAHPLRYDFFAFFPKNPHLSQMLEQIAEERRGADRRLFCDERIAYLVGCAIAEFCEPLTDEALLDSVFHQITTYIIRDAARMTAEKKNVRETPEKALCFRVMNYIDTHLYVMTGLHELAVLTGYHYSYLSSVFRKTTGNTLADYYHGKRLSSARLLLRENRLSVSEIADNLGYSSVYAFSKAYRNRFGLSPREEQKNALERPELDGTEASISPPRPSQTPVTKE